MPPLRVIVRSGGVEQEFFHEEGPLEFGRSTVSDYPRCVIADPTVSRDHLRVTLQPNGWLYVENLSRSLEVLRQDAPPIPVMESQLVGLPVVLSIGNTDVGIGLASGPPPVFHDPPVEPFVQPTPAPPPPAEQPTSLFTSQASDEGITRVSEPIPALDPAPEVAQQPPMPAVPEQAAIPEEPARPPMPEPAPSPAAVEAAPPLPGLAPGIGVAPPPAILEPASPTPIPLAADPATLAAWFERLLLVQYSAATPEQLIEATATALVDRVGFDSGLVLLRATAAGDWEVVATAPADTGQPLNRPLLDQAAEHRRTLYDERFPASPGATAAVVSPLFDENGEVSGAVYGARAPGVGSAEGITPLEATIVQVLAAALSAGLQRQSAPAPDDAESHISSVPAPLTGVEREVTVLAGGVRSFSRLAGRLGPENTFRLLQDLDALSASAIRGNGGTLAPAPGGRILAVWNAPAEDEDHAERACEAARAILAALPALSANWEALAGQSIALALAVHTAPALVGTSSGGDSCVPLGATVELTHSLEAAADTLATPILLSRATRDRLIGETGTRRLGTLRIRGASEPVHVFELLGGAQTPDWTGRRDRYETALARFEAGDWAQAANLLASLVAEGGQIDMPAAQLLARAVEFMRTNPVDFDPALFAEPIT